MRVFQVVLSVSVLTRVPASVSSHIKSVSLYWFAKVTHTYLHCLGACIPERLSEVYDAVYDYG
jgi:hypothetical protein